MKRVDPSTGLVTMKLQSPITQRCRPFQQKITNLFAVVAGVAVSLGLFGPLHNAETRFQFNQQMGKDVLSGSFKAVDRDFDGVVELSEVSSFQASWGDYTWTQADLEAFVWRQTSAQTDAGQNHQRSGLNLFARYRQDTQTQVLQIRHPANIASEYSTVPVSISAMKYSQNQPDQNLFAEQTLELEITNDQSQLDWKVVRLFLAVGLLSLFLWQPCPPQLTTSQKPLQSLN